MNSAAQIDASIVMSLANEYLDGDEFGQYKVVRDEIDVALETAAQDLAIDLASSESWTALRGSTALVVPQSRWNKIVVYGSRCVLAAAGAGLVLAAFAQVLGAFGIRGGPWMAGAGSWTWWIRLTLGTLVWTVFGLSLFGLLLTIRAALPPVRRQVEATRAKETAAANWDDHLRRSVLEMIRLTVNRVLRSTDKVALPDKAPALVELNETTILEAESVMQVERFVSEHEASAMGIAGPRGVGKSTILRYMCREREGFLGVYVPAPVKYDPRSFTQHLYERILEEAYQRETGKRYVFRDVGADRVQAGRLAFALVVLGGAIYTFANADKLHFTPTEAAALLAGAFGLYLLLMVATSTTAFDSLARLTGRPGTGSTSPAVAGAALATAAVAPAALVGAVISILAGVSYGQSQRTKSIESELRDLRWATEQSSGTSHGATLLGGAFEISDENVSTRSRLPITHAELVGRMHTFLRSYIEDSRFDSIILSIDELDKLPSGEDLVAVVNGLKDIFHIYGVHVLVSVSTDALDSFQLRGLPARDAFDSSFDTIVLVSRLSLDDSIEVLDRRVTGFPPEIVYFCHAWSGGLARDLLRTARGCFELHRIGFQTRTDIVVELVARNAGRALTSSARQGGGEDSSLKTHQMYGRALAHVLRHEYDEAAQALLVAPPSARPAIAPMIRYLSVCAELAQTFGPQNGPPKTDPELRSAATLLAARMTAVGDDEVALLNGTPWSTIGWAPTQVVL